MSVQQLPQPVDTGSGATEPDHLYCPCTPDVAVCGADVSGQPDVTDCARPEDVCPLCEVLDEANENTCVRCGF